VKNKLSDLNNHLFAELERLGDEELSGEALTEEIERARAITGVAAQIINNGSLVLKAATAKRDAISADFKTPQMLIED
jgi:hypothetical protein